MLKQEYDNAQQMIRSTKNHGLEGSLMVGKLQEGIYHASGIRPESFSTFCF